MADQVTLACDPGVKGAIAVYRNLELTEVHDFTASEGRVSIRPLRHLFVMADALVIEAVAPFGKNGSIGNFKLGHNYAIVVGAAEVMELSIHRYSPAAWKRAMKLSSDKNRSRLAAADLYPHFADQLNLVKHDGRAEAILLGHHHLKGTTTP